MTEQEGWAFCTSHAIDWEDCIWFAKLVDKLNLPPPLLSINVHLLNISILQDIKKIHIYITF